jgi:outer membrane protein assembly factor BamA
MANRKIIYIVVLILFASVAYAQQQVVMVRVMGNYTIADDDLIEIAAVNIGDEWNDSKLAETRRNLLKTGRFKLVEIKIRSRGSVANGPVILIIKVEEKEEIINKLMFFPLVSYSEDYGWSYGAQLAVDDFFGFDDFITIPLQWGGQKKIAAEMASTDFPGLNKIMAKASWQRRMNPFYQIEETRKSVALEAAKRLGFLIFEGSFEKTAVTFGVEDNFLRVGGSVRFDNRQNSMLPHEALLLKAGWDSYSSDNWIDSFSVVSLESSAFLRVFGQLFVAGNFSFEEASDFRPTYLKKFIGGADSLRGYASASFIGDSSLLASAEIRYAFLPTEIPAKLGLALFYDAGKVWDAVQEMNDVDLRNSVGFSAFGLFSGYGVRMDVARNMDAEWRWHFSTSMKF